MKYETVQYFGNSYENDFFWRNRKMIQTEIV